MITLFGSFVRSEIPRILYSTDIVDPDKYLITGSVGQGNWATVPWVCIFDRLITTTAQKGVYIVYLLSKDTNTLYLTFNQGCTELRRTHKKQEAIDCIKYRFGDRYVLIFSSWCNLIVTKSLIDLSGEEDAPIPAWDPSVLFERSME